ncbi:MAG: type II secretion system protein [Phycisphaerae bacterium]|jgi:prepilin-type N-terminal cleavage/methylation domain-containing protein/prepilin-type processing-associated H-X9-DG protein
MKLRSLGPKADTGFTLVELLIAIAIVAILMVLLLPVVSSMKARANSVRCVSNLRQLYQGSLLYLADHDQKFWIDLMAGDAWYADYPGREVHGPLYYLAYDYVRDSRRPGTVMDCPENTEGAFQVLMLDYAYNGYLCRMPDRSLSPVSMASVTQPSKALLFMDGRQPFVTPGGNPFGPASLYPGKTIGAFVHPNKTANCLFLDGHVQPMTEAELKNDSNGNFYLNPQRPIP